MPTTRRRSARYRDPGLTPEVIDVCLLGQARPDGEIAALEAQGIGYDPFEQFTFHPGDPRVPALWAQHKAALLAEAKRRGIPRKRWWPRP